MKQERRCPPIDARYKTPFRGRPISRDAYTNASHPFNTFNQMIIVVAENIHERAMWVSSGITNGVFFYVIFT